MDYLAKFPKQRIGHPLKTKLTLKPLIRTAYCQSLICQKSFQIRLPRHPISLPRDIRKIQLCILLGSSTKIRPHRSRAFKGLHPKIRALALVQQMKRTHGKCQDLRGCSKKMKMKKTRDSPKATSRGFKILSRWILRKQRRHFSNQKVKAKRVFRSYHQL